MRCLLFVIFLLTTAFATNYETCGGLNKVTKVEVQDCGDDVEFCSFKQGDTKDVKITYEARKTADKVHASLISESYGHEHKWDIPNNDACKDSGIKCPNEKSQTYTYTSSLKIGKDRTPADYVMKWSLKENDENGQLLVCVAFNNRVE